MTNVRDWNLDFGPVTALAGTVTTITQAPQCNYRVEKAMANDTASPPGTGTRIQAILIGNRLQRPASTDTLSLFFSATALGNGVKWDVCERAMTIAVTVSFVKDCTFDLSTFGKAWD